MRVLRNNRPMDKYKGPSCWQKELKEPVGEFKGSLEDPWGSLKVVKRTHEEPKWSLENPRGSLVVAQMTDGELRGN